MKEKILFKNKYRIKSIRKENFDYATPGFYFITICTKNQKEYFGKIIDNKFIENESGKIVRKCWEDLPNHYINCELDAFQIMPTHVHFIIRIKNREEIFCNTSQNVETGLKPVSTVGKFHGLSEMVRAFKSFSARGINNLKGKKYFTWQPRYFDRIIRDDNELFCIREYIDNNPLAFFKD